MDPQSMHRHHISDEVSSSSPSKSTTAASPSTNSSSSLSNYLDRTTPTSTVFPSTSPTLVSSPPTQAPAPTRSISASTPTSSSTTNGERPSNERAKRHSFRQPPPPLQPVSRQSSVPNYNAGQSPSAGLERTFSNHSSAASITQPRPTSPVTSHSIHKSLNALDAKAITRDMERSTQYMRGDDMLTSPSSPTGINSGFYFPPSTSPVPPNTTPYMRQGSISNPTVPSTIIPSAALNASQGDVWQNLCVRVLPLFNGEGVKGSIEDLNELFRRCLSEPLSPQLYRDIEALLRDGMFTLNSKMLGVTDEKLLDRLVEQWSFFFTYALPYFEAVFLPLRTDVRYRSVDDAEMWNVRNMALRSFRDNVILLQTKRLEDVFAKLFTDFGSSQNPAATAAKMLQMTSLLASAPDHNEEIERVLSSLQANWKIMMTKGYRRGFAGVRKARTGFASDNNSSHNQIFGSLP